MNPIRESPLVVWANVTYNQFDIFMPLTLPYKFSTVTLAIDLSRIQRKCLSSLRKFPI